MSWQLLIGLSVVIYSFSALLQKVLLKSDKSDPIAFSIFFQLGVSIVIGLIVLLWRKSIPLPELSGIGFSLLLMAILYSLGNIFVFSSLKSTDASIFTIIFSSKTLFSIVGAMVFLGEVVGPVKWLSILLIIAGIVVTSFKKTKLKLSKGEIFAVLAAMSFGLAGTNDASLIKHFDPYAYSVIGFLLPGLLISLIYPHKLKGISYFLHKDVFYKMILLCTLYGLSASFFFAALQASPSTTVVFAVNAFGSVLTVVLSIFILKEKENMFRKILGVLLALAGLILVNS